MANSKFYIGDLNVKSLKLGNNDVKLYLGYTLLYPLSKPIDDAIVTCASVTYNGSNQIAQDITVRLNGVTLIENTDYIVTQNFGGINAGSYEVVISGVGDYEGTANGTFIINKVTPTVVAPTAKSLTYNGSAQALVNAGSTNYGTLQYSLDNSSYSTSIPSGINAASYTVYYIVVGDSNINDVAANSISVSIAKADPAYTSPTANDRTYDTTSKALLNGGSTSDGTMQYSSDNSTWGATIPSQTNASTYTTYWRIVGDSNHNDKASASISTTVFPKTVSSPIITLSQNSYVYNNTAYQPTPTVKDDSVTIASSEYTVSYSNNTNVGTGTCTITDNAGGNYTVSGSKTFTITCAECTAPTAKSLTWNGSAQALVNAGYTSFGTMVYSTDNSSWSTSVPSGTNATSYTVYWKVTGNTNVCCTASSSVACSIAKAAMTYIAPSATTYTYDNTARALMSGGTANGGSIEYSASQTGTYTTTVPTQTNAGTYVTWWKAVPDSNHSGGTNAASASTTIAKADQSAPTAVGATTTYPTTATATASGGGGVGSIEWESAQSQTSVGSHTTRARWTGNANYNASPWSSYVTVQVYKASRTVTFSNPTTSVTVGSTVSNVANVSAGSSDGTLTYSSSDTSKATVNSSGVVTGVAQGSVTITATITGGTNYNDASGSYGITIEGQFEPIINNYTYTGSKQTVILQPGTYTFECWGAQGGAGYSSTSSAGGKGGYSKGTLTLNTATTVYVYVGGSGGSSTGQIINGGFNGGGRAYAPSSNYNNGAGGGASDIRIGTDSLYARAIVAGGGGGGGTRSTAQYYYPGGYGGGTSGGTPSSYYQGYGTGGGQSAPGAAVDGTGPVSASFGTGGGNSTTDTSSRIAGGGGGWYGGGGARRGPAGGGSGYVLTSSSYKPSGYILGSDYYLSNAETKGGNTSFPSTSSGSETGHSGNGYVRITQIG